MFESSTIIENNIEFGEQAVFSSSDSFVTSSTLYVEDDSITNSISYRSGAYKTIDYSEEKIMEAYRKVNKMLGAI